MHLLRAHARVIRARPRPRRSRRRARRPAGFRAGLAPPAPSAVRRARRTARRIARRGHGVGFALAPLAGLASNRAARRRSRERACRRAARVRGCSRAPRASRRDRFLAALDFGPDRVGSPGFRRVRRACRRNLLVPSATPRAASRERRRGILGPVRASERSRGILAQSSRHGLSATRSRRLGCQPVRFRAQCTVRRERAAPRSRAPVPFGAVPCAGIRQWFQWVSAGGPGQGDERAGARGVGRASRHNLAVGLGVAGCPQRGVLQGGDAGGFAVNREVFVVDGSGITCARVVQNLLIATVSRVIGSCTCHGHAWLGVRVRGSAL